MLQLNIPLRVAPRHINNNNTHLVRSAARGAREMKVKLQLALHRKERNTLKVSLQKNGTARITRRSKWRLNSRPPQPPASRATRSVRDRRALIHHARLTDFLRFRRAAVHLPRKTRAANNALPFRRGTY
jgi:hypothetical protein